MSSKENPSSTKMGKFGPFKKQGQPKDSRKSSESKEQPKYVQDLIGIEEIYEGYVFTKSGSIVKILEVLPINFTEKEGVTKDAIANAFGFGLKQCPKNGHIKIMRSTIDMAPFVSNVRSLMAEETNEKLKKRVDDYINFTLTLQSKGSTQNRFFFIFEYEGNADGKKSLLWEEIRVSMFQQTNAVKNALESAGNYVIDYKDDNMAICEILYSHFNPLSSKTEPFHHRFDKVVDAMQSVSARENQSLYAPLEDYIAPRGIKFGEFDYLITDGIYTSYLILKDTAFPQSCYAGTVIEQITSELEDFDVDIFYKQQARERALWLLDRANVVSRGVARNLEGDENKVETLTTTASNAKYLRSCMVDNDEELYNVSIILTIRARSRKELKAIMDNFVRVQRTKSLYFETAFLHTQDFYEMTMPLMNINNTIFNANCRNMTNSSIAALYCFTTYEMFEPTALCIGTTIQANTLVSINNFNTKKFVNPHISIFGTSGAGKTFFECMLTSRMRMHGTRLVYILPLKGHEYKECVLSLGGEFISLRPGSQACLNILEIRPEAEANIEGLDDEEIKAEMETRPSLLAKKITSVVTWFRILAGEDKLTTDEIGELDTVLTHMYAKYGITHDNNSIWENGIQLSRTKTMPILEDLYNALLENEYLKRRASILKPWVFGNFKNMNGQTNVDLNNKCIAFDINEDYIGEEALPAVMYIAFDAGYDICKRDEFEQCAIALDEIWKMLSIPACAKQIFKMIKILRAYSAAAIVATQDIEDCMNNEHGRTIMTNSATKIFLKCTKEELAAFSDSVQLSAQNREQLTTMPRGIGFITFNSERVLVSFRASSYEEELYTTDINVKKRLKAERERRESK